MRTITAELVADAQADLGEGPAWDAAAGRLIWVDITGSVVHELLPDGRSRRWNVPEHVGAAVPRTRGGLLLAVRSGFAALADDGSVSVVARVEADDAGTRMNDGKCDPQGRFWAGTMSYSETPGTGSLYRLDPDGGVHRILTSVTISNGLGWSPDGTVMYYTDTATGGVDRFRFDAAAGALADRRRLITVDPADGSPDGMT
ncbi:MAG TPA: SMP-30/gluconolactonase/LRE family protein, partial [Trebonia sp.]